MTDPRIAGLISTGTIPTGAKHPTPGSGTPRKKTGRPPGRKSSPNTPQQIAKREREKLAAQAEHEKLMNSPATPQTPAETPAASDKTLFGTVPEFELPPEAFAGSGTNPEPSPIPNDGINEPSPEYFPPDSATNPDTHRPLANMVWSMFISIMVVFVGPFWQPRKMGGNPGELAYDENEMVIASFCKYLAHVGMVALSPAQEFALSVANYSFPRLFATIDVLKAKFFKKKMASNDPVKTPGDTRFAEKPAETPAAP